MPTPKQLEKLTAAGSEPRMMRTPGPADAMPPEYWESVLNDPRADAGPRPERPSGRCGCPEFLSIFCRCRAPAAAESSRSRRSTRSAFTARTRSSRTSRSGYWTIPASSRPGAMKKTVAGACSNECGQDAIDPNFQEQPKVLGISGTATSGCLRQSNADFRGAVDFADSMKSELL
jgi:hypothetical protein